MSEASGKFRNTPPRVTDDVRARRREPQTPQTAAEKLSHNTAKRWRMDGTRAHMGSDTLSSEVLDAKQESSSQAQEAEVPG